MFPKGKSVRSVRGFRIRRVASLDSREVLAICLVVIYPRFMSFVGKPCNGFFSVKP